MCMIRGIGTKPYIDLDPYLDIKGFKNLHPEIAKGYIVNWKPIYSAVEEYLALPETHPIRVTGDPMYFTDLKDFRNRNIFTRYLKTVMGANDPYTYYFLWDQGDWNERNAERQKTEESKYFPGVVKWVENLQQSGIIDRIGRVIFFHCDHNGRAFEHRDLDARNGVLGDHQYTPHTNEFIHIRYRTKRGFYIWDPDTENKYYINANAAFWNDQDWHGGEESKEVEYGMRIDCKFSNSFRKKLGIDYLEHY